MYLSERKGGSLEVGVGWARYGRGALTLTLPCKIPDSDGHAGSA